MNIVTYNIWNGLTGIPEARDNFLRWMTEQQPDVVALEELNGFTEKSLAELASAYGHPYVAIVKEEGYPVGITSRQPLTVVKRLVQGYGHGLLHVRTYDLDFLVTHLNPFSWLVRIDEAKRINEYIASNDLKRYVLMGDMNAYSPFDAEEVEGHTTLIERRATWRKTHPDDFHDDRFDYSVMSEFYSAGLIDALQLHVPVKKRMTYPSALVAKGPWQDLSQTLTGERLDYILISQELVPCCTQATAHNGPDAEGISDHYPVSVQLEIG